MNAAEEHVLEHALGELLGEEQTDLGERVLRELRSAQEREARPPKGRLLWLASAAAVLVAAFFIVDSIRDEGTADDTVALATSEGPLDVFREGELEPRPLDAFGPGETIINGPESERRFVLASGEAIHMGPCSMVTLDRDAQGTLLSPLLGSVTLEANARSNVRIRTNIGTLALRAPGQLRVEMLAEGYTLEHPERFKQLAQEIHMKSAIAPLILTVATVVEGSALLETAEGSRPLAAGESLQGQSGPSTEQIQRKLMEQVGTWDLSVTNVDLTGKRAEPIKGVETCRAGPGDKWLISESKIQAGTREVSMLTVVGFNPGKGSYTGNLVDSFGGEMGMLRGTPTEDLQVRTLEMFSAVGTPGFDARSHMRWESPDLRYTTLEILREEEWVMIRETVHRRRE
jgi:hypothetical protein